MRSINHHEWCDWWRIERMEEFSGMFFFYASLHTFISWMIANKKRNDDRILIFFYFLSNPLACCCWCLYHKIFVCVFKNYFQNKLIWLLVTLHMLRWFDGRYYIEQRGVGCPLKMNFVNWWFFMEVLLKIWEEIVLKMV